MRRFKEGVARACKNLPVVPEKINIHKRLTKKTCLNKELTTPVSPKLTRYPNPNDTNSPTIAKSQICILEQKKVKKLLKIKKNQDKLIQEIQISQNNLSQKLEFSKSQKILEFEEVVPANNEVKKTKGEEKEVKKLEKELEESKKVLEDLKSKNDKYSSKMIKHSSELEKIKLHEKTIRGLKTTHESEIVNLRRQIEQKISKTRLNQVLKEELCEKLKKNEEKRLIINKFSSHIDVQMKIMNDKISDIDQEKHKILIETEETRNKIKTEDQVIARLLFALKDLNKKDTQLREANSDLNFKFESAKNELEKTQKFAYFQENEFEFEMKNLEKTLSKQDKEEPEEKVLIRRATLNNRITDFTDFETENLQSAYFIVQKQLDQAKGALNKLQKNEEYLKSQYSAKEAKIEQMEKIISLRKTQPKMSEVNEKFDFKYSGLKDLLTVIEDLKLDLSQTQNSVTCVSCYKVPNFIYVLSPCTHIYCPTCRSSLQHFCMKCAGSYRFVITPGAINKVLEYFQDITETIIKLRKCLSIEYFKLNTKIIK